MNWSLAELRRRLAANPDLSLERPLEATRRPRTRGRGESASTTYDAADELLARLRTLAPDVPPPIRDYPLDRFRIDLAWPSAMLAIEVDGGQWAAGGGKHGSKRDYQKTRRIVAAGWRLLRFTAGEVKDNPLGVIAEIREALR